MLFDSPRTSIANSETRQESQKSQCLLREGSATVSRYEYIDSERNDPGQTNPVTKMCGWLEVSTSGFYH